MITEPGELLEDEPQSSPDPDVGAAADFIQAALLEPDVSFRSITRPTQELRREDGEIPEKEETPTSSYHRPTCRFAVIESPVVRRNAMGVIDPHEVVKLGRDKQNEPHIRLKEMAISKHHAYVYWDSDRLTWALVDSGSVHGTFLQREGEESTRLSNPRNASIPYALRHQDIIKIGETSFLVHIHAAGVLCSGCSKALTDIVSAGQTRSAPVPKPPTWSEGRPTNHKDAMKSLKNTLLRRRSPDVLPAADRPQYVDRSKRRREAFGADAIPIATNSEGGSTSKRVRYTDPRLSTVLQITAQSEPSETNLGTRTPVPSNKDQAIPLPESNIGHKLLRKHGWIPGETLGTPDSGSALLEPLQPAIRPTRAGLGSS